MYGLGIFRFYFFQPGSIKFLLYKDSTKCCD